MSIIKQKIKENKQKANGGCFNDFCDGTLAELRYVEQNENIYSLQRLPEGNIPLIAQKMYTESSVLDRYIRCTVCYRRFTLSGAEISQ